MELHGTVTFQLPVGCGGSSLPSQWRNSPKPICGICLSPRLWASLSRSWINMTEVDARASSPLTGERNLDSISSAGARIFSLRIAFFTPAPPTLFRIHDFRFSTRLWISNLRKLELRLKARGRTLIQLNKKKKKRKRREKEKGKEKVVGGYIRRFDCFVIIIIFPIYLVCYPRDRPILRNVTSIRVSRGLKYRGNVGASKGICFFFFFSI